MDEPTRRLSPLSRRVWRLGALAFWGMVTVAGVILAIFVDEAMPWSIIAPFLLAVFFAGVVPELRWRRARWDLTDEGIDIQSGVFSIYRTLVPWTRVQHVETQRGLFEQAFGLATVIVHNAAGSHTIPYLAQADAEELRERIAARAKTDDDE
jgi:membrane protein YdbS with pleckstrin-like domain